MLNLETKGVLPALSIFVVKLAFFDVKKQNSLKKKKDLHLLFDWPNSLI